MLADWSKHQEQRNGQLRQRIWLTPPAAFAVRGTYMQPSVSVSLNGSISSVG